MENRKDFFARLGRLPRERVLQAELAYTLAKNAHRWQRRQEVGPDGDPLRYFEHCRRVALIVIDEMNILDADLICTALLHDVIEDTRYISEEHVRTWFNPRVAECVALVTKIPKAGYVGRLLECGEWRALIVKAADRLDNLRSLSACPREKIERKLRETVKWYYPIFQRMLDIVPLDLRERTSALTNEVARTVERVRLNCL